MRKTGPFPDYRFQPMEQGDLAEVIQFWQGMEGIGLFIRRLRRLRRAHRRGSP